MEAAQIARAFAGLSPKRSHLVGVSGGRDSVALLHLLEEMGFAKVIVCHLNHRLRGAASRADARLVEKLGRDLGYETYIGEADVKDLAKTEKRSLETAAREARHRFFAEAGRRFRCRSLVLAHHADDRVETFLFNLFRGSGSTGLVSMKRETEHIMAGLRMQVCRPLLGIWRREIEDLVRERRWKYREDSSNKDPRYTRNRMRHQILPFLAQTFGRDIRQAVFRAAEILSDEEEWMRELTPRFESGKLSCAALADEPVAAVRRAIREWLSWNGVTGTRFEDVEAVREMLNPDGLRAANLPQDRVVRRKRGELLIEKQ